MTPFYIVFALAAGAMLTLQIGVNSSLSKHMHNPLGAATIAFAIGTLALIAYMILARQNFPSLSTIRAVPIWTLTGGALGAFYVAATIYCAPHLGSTLLIVLVVTGQMIISLVLDHYGVAGFPVHTLNIWRVVGVALVLAGVVFIIKH